MQGRRSSLSEDYVLKELQANRRFRKFVYQWFEAFLFVAVLLGGGLSLYFAYRTEDSFWQSFLISLAANFIVFVLLFWIFQYFLGRQPSGESLEDLSYKDALVIPQSSEEIETLSITPEYGNHRKAKQRQTP